jgi:hypothetical protein
MESKHRDEQSNLGLSMQISAARAANDMYYHVISSLIGFLRTLTCHRGLKPQDDDPTRKPMLCRNMARDVLRPLLLLSIVAAG